MYILGGQVYEDEEIMGYSYSYPHPSSYQSIYEQDPDEYIADDEFEEITVHFFGDLKI
jgi:hypothetical protein